MKMMSFALSSTRGGAAASGTARGPDPRDENVVAQASLARSRSPIEMVCRDRRGLAGVDRSGHASGEPIGPDHRPDRRPILAKEPDARPGRRTSR